MWNSQQQQAFDEVLKEFTAINKAADDNHDYTVVYLRNMVVDMLALIPKRKQKECITQVQTFINRQPVKVKSMMTGELVEIPRGDKGTCLDPSMERYWTM